MKTEYDRLADAWHDLWLEVIEALYVYRLLDWLNRRLEK